LAQDISDQNPVVALYLVMMFETRPVSLASEVVEVLVRREDGADDVGMSVHKCVLQQIPYFASMISGRWGDDLTDHRVEVQLTQNQSNESLEQLFQALYVAHFSQQAGVQQPHVAPALLSDPETFIQAVCVLELAVYVCVAPATLAWIPCYSVDAVEAGRQLGNKLFEEGHLHKSVACYTKSMWLADQFSVSPDYCSKLYSNRAAAFLKLAQWREAVADGEEAVRRNPSNQKGIWRRGVAELQRSRGRQALRDFIQCKRQFAAEDDVLKCGLWQALAVVQQNSHSESFIACLQRAAARHVGRVAMQRGHRHGLLQNGYRIDVGHGAAHVTVPLPPGTTAKDVCVDASPNELRLRWQGLVRELRVPLPAIRVESLHVSIQKAPLAIAAQAKLATLLDHDVQQ